MDYEFTPLDKTQPWLECQKDTFLAVFGIIYFKQEELDYGRLHRLIKSNIGLFRVSSHDEGRTLVQITTPLFAKQYKLIRYLDKKNRGVFIVNLEAKMFLKLTLTAFFRNFYVLRCHDNRKNIRLPLDKSWNHINKLPLMARRQLEPYGICFPKESEAKKKSNATLRKGQGKKQKRKKPRR